MKWSDDQVIKTIMETNSNVKVLITQLSDLRATHVADILRCDDRSEKEGVSIDKLTKRVENIEKSSGDPELIQKDWKYYGKEGGKVSVFLGMIVYLLWEAFRLLRGV